MVIRGQALAEEVVIVLAVIEHPRETTVLMVRQLVDPEVMVPHDLTISVTVEVLHDELLDELLEDLLDDLLEDC